MVFSQVLTSCRHYDLGKDDIYIFINSMIEESKYHTMIPYYGMTKKDFYKKLAMTKKMMKNLKNLLNVGVLILFILRVVLK